MINAMIPRISLEKLLSFSNVFIFFASIFIFIISFLFLIDKTANNIKHTVIDELNMLEGNISTELHKQSLELQKLKNKIEKEKITKNIKEEDFLRKLKPQVSDNIKEILLLDKNLNIISALYQNKDKYKGINLKHRQYLQYIIKNTDKIQIDEPVIGALTNAWAIPIVVAIVDIKNNFDGVLIFSLHLKSFSKFLETKKYTPVLKKIHFLRSPLKDQRYTTLDNFFSHPIKNFIKLITFNKENKLKFVTYSSTLEQKIYIVYDVNDLTERFYNQIKIYIIIILLCSLISGLLIQVLRDKIVLPIKRIIQRIENTLQIQENNSETFIRNENLKADKINRLIKTFDSLLVSFQDTSKRIESLNNNILISHLFFNSLIQNIRDNQKFSNEILQDRIDVINLPYLLADISQEIKQNDNIIDELHELSVKCSQEIKSGKERINLLELLRKHFAEFEIHLDGDTDRLSLELYEASFIETLYHVFKLAIHSKGNELYIHITREEKYCQIDFSPLMITTELSSNYYYELQKVQLRALVNNIIVSFNKVTAQVSFIIML